MRPNIVKALSVVVSGVWCFTQHFPTTWHPPSSRLHIRLSMSLNFGRDQNNRIAGIPALAARPNAGGKWFLSPTCHCQFRPKTQERCCSWYQMVRNGAIQGAIQRRFKERYVSIEPHLIVEHRMALLGQARPNVQSIVSEYDESPQELEHYLVFWRLHPRKYRIKSPCHRLCRMHVTHQGLCCYTQRTK